MSVERKSHTEAGLEPMRAGAFCSRVVHLPASTDLCARDVESGAREVDDHVAHLRIGAADGDLVGI